MDPLAARELVSLLQRFARASDRYVESVGQAHSTHRTDMNALAVIMRFEGEGTPPTPGELSRELSLSSPATTALLDRLERHGHIQRLRTDSDRRLVRIRATDKARSDGRLMFGPLAEHMTAVINRHDAGEIEIVSRFIAEAIAGVDLATAATVRT